MRELTVTIFLRPNGDYCAWDGAGVIAIARPIDNQWWTICNPHTGEVQRRHAPHDGTEPSKSHVVREVVRKFLSRDE